MQSYFRMAFISICSLAAVACSTVAQGPAYSASKAPAVQPDRATVYIYRKYAEPTAFGAMVKINGAEATSLSQNGYTWVTVAPGSTEIRAVWAGLSGQKDSLITLDTKPATSYFVELTGISKFTGATMGAGGTFTEFRVKMGSGLSQVDPVAAEKVLEACCKYQKPLATQYQ